MQLFQGPISAFLCASLLCPATSILALDSPSSARNAQARTAYSSATLRGDQRILHALNRFSFGPRPGDLEAARTMGLEKWFDQQLHPESLDESELNAHLALFPAMQWSPQDLLYFLPGNAVLRQVMSGRLPLPEGGMLRVIYQNQIDRIHARQQARNQDGGMQIGMTATAVTKAQSDTAMESERAESPTPMSKEAFSAPAPGTVDPMEPEARRSEPVRPPFNSTLLESVLTLPPQQRIERLASLQQPELDGFLKSLRPRERKQLVQNLDPMQRQTLEALEGPERVVVEEFIAERLTRDIYSNAQLQEVMTDFWLNHFNIYLRKNPMMPYYLVSYARDSIRPFALGKFEDLLESVAHSPAMLVYLDNASSIGPHSRAAERAQFAAWRRAKGRRKAPEGLNENYGRELMELHTVGVNGGYTQADVIQAARILTGWTVERPLRGGGFTFNPNRHEPGTKTVMGKKFKDHGEQQGRELLHFLAARPATAQFISRELAERFVSDNPPHSLVNRMAHTYLSTGGDISAVLKTLFHSPEFWSTSAYRAKVKTPLEFVVSAVRASNADIQNLRPLANALRQMGMPLYGCVPPTGYSWQESAWVNSGALVDRMNFALALAANRLSGIKTAWSTEGTRAAAAASPQLEESRLEALIVPGGVAASTRTAVLDQLEKQEGQNAASAQRRADMREMQPTFRTRPFTAWERDDRLLAGLLLGSPEFQRR